MKSPFDVPPKNQDRHYRVGIYCDQTRQQYELQVRTKIHEAPDQVKEALRRGLDIILEKLHIPGDPQ